MGKFDDTDLQAATGGNLDAYLETIKGRYGDNQASREEAKFHYGALVNEGDKTILWEKHSINVNGSVRSVTKELDLKTFQPVGNIKINMEDAYANWLDLGHLRIMYERKMQAGEWLLLPSRICTKNGKGLVTEFLMVLYDTDGRRRGYYTGHLQWAFMSQLLGSRCKEGRLRGGLVFLVERATGVLLASSNLKGMDRRMVHSIPTQKQEFKYIATEAPVPERIRAIAKAVVPSGDWSNVGPETRAVEVGPDDEQIYLQIFEYKDYGLDVVGVYAVEKNVLLKDLDTSSFTLTVVSMVTAIIVSGISLAAVVFRLASYHRRNEEAKKERVKKSCRQWNTIFCPMHVISLAHLRRLGKLITHEQAADQHLLVSLHDYNEAKDFWGRHKGVFISHQWLGWTLCDPTNAHYPKILLACTKLCEDLSESPDNFYIWVDVLSIPQMNQYSQSLAVMSLTAYVSLAPHFCIVAPSAVHHDSGEQCDLNTYSGRGWCRLEQFARLTTHGGTQKMYIMEENNIEPADFSNEVIWNGLLIQDGIFSCCQKGHAYGSPCDKEKCVETQLGLYNRLRMQHASSSGAATRAMMEFIQANKKRVFPPAYFDDLVERLEKQNASELANAAGARESCVEKHRLIKLPGGGHVQAVVSQATPANTPQSPNHAQAYAEKSPNHAQAHTETRSAWAVNSDMTTGEIHI